MRGLFGTLAAPMTRASAGTPSYGMIPPLGSIQSAAGVLISQATAMSVSTVYACVRRRAIDVARCTPSLYTLETDGSRKLVEGHPVNKLLVRPNRVQTWLEFSEMLQVGYVMRDNAYAAIRRDRRGDPIELIPINPDAVTVLEAADGSIFYNVSRIGLWQIAMLRDFPQSIPAEDMLHIRGLTFNGLVGIARIGLGRDTIGLAMAQEQQAARWIANGARPSTWLKSPKTLSEVAAKRLKAQFDELFSGLTNTGKTVVLEEGLEPVALQLTAEDIEFIQSRNFQVLDVCRLFGVPPHKVGVVDKSAAQNIPQQDQDYVNSTVSQDLERVEQKWQLTFDLDKEGIFLDLNEQQLLRGDILTRRNAARLGILSGLTTPDEERKAEGLPPMGGRAAQLMVPANTAALGSDMSGQAADGAGRPKDGNLPDPGAATNGDQPGTEDVAAAA